MKVLFIVFFLSYSLARAEDRGSTATTQYSALEQQLMNNLLELHKAMNPAHWKPNVDQWDLKLQLEHASIPRGAEMMLEITLTNIGKERGLLLENNDTDIYDIAVVDDAGDPIRTTKMGHHYLHPEHTIIHLHLIGVEPSQSDRREVDLAKLFELSTAGRYVVTVNRFGFPPSKAASMSFIAQ